MEGTAAKAARSKQGGDCKESSDTCWSPSLKKPWFQEKKPFPGSYSREVPQKLEPTNWGGKILKQKETKCEGFGFHATKIVWMLSFLFFRGFLADEFFFLGKQG